MKYTLRHFKVLLQRIFALMLFYSLIRLIFLIQNWQGLSTNFDDLAIAFAHGLRFDLSAILYLNVLFILMSVPKQFIKTGRVYETTHLTLFLLVNFAGFLFNIIDSEYFKFQKKRSGIDLFGGENDIMTLLPSYIRDYGWMILLSLVFSYLLYKLYKRGEMHLVAGKQDTIGLAVIANILLIGLVVIGARGGLQVKPLRMISAFSYGSIQNANLVLNTPFTMIQSADKPRLPRKNYFSQEELDKIVPLTKKYQGSFLFEQKNVMILILESFSNEFIGHFNPKSKELSPFLDSLMKEGYLFSNAFANGKKSNEAMPSIIGSIPSLMNDVFTNSLYQGNKINTLVTTLKEKNYHSVFFHGGQNGSMSFDVFAKNAGYDQYIGMNEYNNLADYDGNWGIYDAPFMQFAAQHLSAGPKPFIATLFSLSSHPPYKIPESYAKEWKNIKDPKLRAFRYTDESLRQFFQYARTKNWYTNTLFVIVPDHTPDTKNREYDSAVSFYKIPILFFDPSASMKGEDKRVMQQVDIMPSVLTYLHYDLPYKSFGKSIWESNENPMAVNYRDGIYQCIDSSYVLQYSNDQVLALYNYKFDPYLRVDLKSKQVQKRQELLRYLQAYIQAYNNTLIDNNYFISEKEDTLHH